MCVEAIGCLQELSILLFEERSFPGTYGLTIQLALLDRKILLSPHPTTGITSRHHYTNTSSEDKAFCGKHITYRAISPDPINCISDSNTVNEIQAFPTAIFTYFQPLAH